MPQAGPEYPRWYDAGDRPRQDLPTWARTQPPTENTFPAPPDSVRGMTASQPPAPQGPAPQPALPVQNLTTQALWRKGVPEADIGAAISDPGKMQDLLNQYYGRGSAIASGVGGGGFYDRSGRAIPTDQPEQTSMPAAATPDNYLPFGWAGLQALLR
jgi:hypothetical protein